VAATIEREIKLRFAGRDDARAAVLATGAMPARARRLQDDRLLDTTDELLRRSGSVLRVRNESGASSLTLKGPVRDSAMKVREELEVSVGDGGLTLDLLDRLGFLPWFRYQKYREEFSLGDLIVAIDETPIGTFVELEGSESGITAMAQALGRDPADYVLASYRALYCQDCLDRGVAVANMLFGDTGERLENE
jgi:adenylate cyclase class 2